MYVLDTKLLKVAAIALVAMAGPAIAGSTVGGSPSNGGGTTFGAPSGGTDALALVTALGGQALAEAIASGDPAQIEAALGAAIAADFPGGAASADLSPIPGMTGPQTVALLTNLINDFAAAIGLSPSSPAIQQLLQIAASAVT